MVFYPFLHFYVTFDYAKKQKCNNSMHVSYVWWLRIGANLGFFWNLKKFTNRNKQSLFKYQCLDHYGTIWHQYLQVFSLHMVQMKLPGLGLWGALGCYILFQSCNWQKSFKRSRFSHFFTFFHS